MKFLALLKSWWAAHLTIFVGIVALLDPSVEHYASQHPGQAFAGVLTLVVGAILSPARPVEKLAIASLVTQPAVAAIAAATPATQAAIVEASAAALPTPLVPLGKK